jgi:hypothetical protein
MQSGGEGPYAGPSRFSIPDEVGPRVGVGFRFNEPVLRCHADVGLVRCTEMEPTDAEKLKARRVQQLLYVLIALMIGVPTVIFILQTFR